MHDIFTESINSLICWADKYGYQIGFVEGGVDSISREQKYIEINSSNSAEEQFYILLHECGHVLIYNNNSFFSISKVLKKFKKNSEVYKIFSVIEEIEAWKRGFILAQRLGICVDEDVWNKKFSSAIKKYMIWAVK